MIYIKPYFIDLSEVLYIEIRTDDFYEYVVEFKDHSRLYSDHLTSTDYEMIKEAIISYNSK